MRKPVFNTGFFYQVQHKLGCTAAEMVLEILDLGNRGIVLSI